MKIKAALQGIVVCAVVLLAAIMFTTCGRSHGRSGQEQARESVVSRVS